MIIDTSVTPVSGNVDGHQWLMYTVLDSVGSTLTIHYRRNVATWRDKFVCFAADFRSGDSVLLSDHSRPFHTVNLSGHPQLPELTDEQCLTLALGAFLWPNGGMVTGRRGLDVIDAYRLFTWNKREHVDAVIFDQELSPVVSWTAFLAAVHYPRLSLELAVGLAGAGDGGTGMSLYSYYDPGVAYEAVGSELISHLLGGRFEDQVSTHVTDTVLWYAYRVAQVFISHATNGSGGTEVTWRDIDPTSYGVGFNDDLTGRRLLACDDPSAVLSVDDYEFFVPAGPDMPAALDLSGLDDQEQIDLSGLIEKLLSTRLLCYALEAKDGLERLKDNGQLLSPAFFLDGSSAFVPLPKGFFALLASSLDRPRTEDDAQLSLALSTDARDAYNDPRVWGFIPNRTVGSWMDGVGIGGDEIMFFPHVLRMVQLGLSACGVEGSSEEVAAATKEIMLIDFDLDCHLRTRGLSGEPADAFRSLLMVDALTNLRNTLAEYYADYVNNSDVALDWYLRLSGFEVTMRA